MLDQLTFGARVDSPTATKLPLLLAVALLKDRNGVIDIDLPIAGSLDDPEFSVGGLIIRVIINLITKVVTAPFAILGALAGGGEQLAFVEFAPGRAQTSRRWPRPSSRRCRRRSPTVPASSSTSPAARSPTSTATGSSARGSTARCARRNRNRPEPELSATADATVVEAAEYPRFLAAVYEDAKLPDKPKNALGLAKEIPPAEMETLLLASYTVDDEALNALANERAQAVKSWLTDTGGIASERMFLVASKLTAEGVKDGGAPTRVDFALK